MIRQLLQVQKLHNVPLILSGNMYADPVQWCKTNMLRADCPMASLKDMDIPMCGEDGPAILRIIREQHAAGRKTHER